MVDLSTQHTGDLDPREKQPPTPDGARRTENRSLDTCYAEAPRKYRGGRGSGAGCRTVSNVVVPDPPLYEKATAEP